MKNQIKFLLSIMLLAVSLTIGYAPTQAAPKPPTMEKIQIIVISEKVSPAEMLLMVNSVSPDVPILCVSQDKFDEIKGSDGQKLQEHIAELQSRQIYKINDCEEFTLLPAITYEPDIAAPLPHYTYINSTFLPDRITSKALGRPQVSYFNKLC